MGPGFSSGEAPGLGVNQTKVIAGSAYVGSCTLTKDLVAALLGCEASSFEPDGVVGLLSAHEAATGALHTVSSLASEKSVQQKLSTERHQALFERLKARASIRSQNLMLSCTMPHASDWLLAPPIPGLGLGLQSDVFRTALKFRLGIPLFNEPFPGPALSSSDGKAVLSRWTSLEITHPAAITVLLWCFATETCGTFSVTQVEPLVSQRW